MDSPHFRMESEVAFADTDASGWMHFSSILRYAERAEHAFLRSRGVVVFDRSIGGWPRAKVTCDYKIPMQAGDVTTVDLAITRLGVTSITWEFEVLNAAGEVAASGSMTTVRVGQNGRPCEIPPQERAALECASRKEGA